MDQEFDPYLELLGIPKVDQPPNCYRLLGIPDYTSNKQVIANGAARQMQFLRRVGGDQYMDDVQDILNEISKVRILLLDDEKRLEYDRNLKAKERARSGKPPGSDSDSMSASRSQSHFDLLAPTQREVGRVTTVQLLFLSGPRVGQTLSLQKRDLTIGPSSRYDVMLPTRNGSQFNLDHEIDQWVLSSDETSFAVNGRLVSGLTTVSDGDVLRFTADGPDLQFIEEVDLTRHLETLDKYEDEAPCRTDLPIPSGRYEGSRISNVGANFRMSSPAPAQSPPPPRQQPTTRQQPAASTAQPNREHESRLVKRPESQKSRGVAGTVMAIADRAMGRNQGFSKKTGAAFDWQICVFWLAVGGTLAAISSLIIYALFK